jgi:hypothetical protein
MHAKQQRLLILLAVVALALYAVIVWVKPPVDKDSPGEKSPQKPLFEKLDRDSVQRVELARASDDAPLVFERSEGRWRIVAPLQEGADQRRVNDLVSRLANLQYTQSIEGADPEPFGLGASPVAIVRFSGENMEAREVHVGHAAPVGYATYLRVGREGPIRAVNGKLDTEFTRPLDDYRDHSVWSFTESEVDRVEWRYRPRDGAEALAPPASLKPIEAEDDLGLDDAPPEEPKLSVGPVQGLLRKDAHGWWLGEDGPRADTEKVAAFLREAADLRIKSFAAPTPSEATELGVLDIRVGSGLHRLSLLPGPGQDLLARTPLRDDPVILEQGALPLLGRDPASFLDAKLLRLRRYTLTAFSVELGEVSWEARKAEGRWPSTAEDILDLLEETPALRTLLPVEAPAQVWGRLLLDEGETRRESLIVGPPRADGMHSVRDEAGGPPFLVAAERIEALQEGLRGAAVAAAEPTTP